MINRFEYSTSNILLINGILFLSVGVLIATTQGIYSWQPYLWWISSLIWTFRYISFQKHGFLKIDSSVIQINHANLKGLQKIDKRDINRIDFTPKAFIVNLNSGKTIKIHKGSMAKGSFSDLKEILIRDYEQQTNHNKD